MQVHRNGACPRKEDAVRLVALNGRRLTTISLGSKELVERSSFG